MGGRPCLIFDRAWPPGVVEATGATAVVLGALSPGQGKGGTRMAHPHSRVGIGWGQAWVVVRWFADLKDGTRYGGDIGFSSFQSRRATTYTSHL